MFLEVKANLVLFSIDLMKNDGIDFSDEIF